MTRDQIRKIIYNIIEDIEPVAHDDSGLHIPPEEINRVTDKIMDLWDKGFTYEV